MEIRQLTDEEKKKYRESNVAGFDEKGNPVRHECHVCGTRKTRYLHNKKWHCVEHFIEHRGNIECV